MTLQPVAVRTVTPNPVWYQPGCSGVSSVLEWPTKQAGASLTYWLDASLELAAIGNSVTIESFSSELVYGDTDLILNDATTSGNVYGLLISDGTAGLVYVVQISATLSDGEILTWPVAIGIAGQYAGGDLPVGPIGQFNTEFLTWFNGLPTSAPETPLTPWNDGGILAVTPMS